MSHTYGVYQAHSSQWQACALPFLSYVVSVVW